MILHLPSFEESILPFIFVALLIIVELILAFINIAGAILGVNSHRWASAVLTKTGTI
jgi:hypothetical protein